MTHRQFEKYFAKELLPCPFCGKRPILVQWRDTDKPNATWVECRCGIISNNHYDDCHIKAAAKAIKKWNRRRK